jgi:hypothetical protein
MTANTTRSIGSLIAHTVFVCVFAVANEANAITIRVPQDFATIRAAIDSATDGDEIVVSPGVYVENVNFRGKNVILRSVNPTDRSTVEATIVDGNQKGSVVTFAGTETASAVLSGFTVKNGSASVGGGISGNGTTARIEHNVITSNSTSGSGYSHGGGLYWCDGTIQNNVITSNSTSGSGYYSHGGGLYGCDGTIQNNVITNNSAGGTYGGGGGLCGCHGTIQNNVIANNSADGGGGGLYWCDGTIQNNVIANNSAGGGGGLYWCGGTIQNNVIANNSADGGGGGLYGCHGTIQNNVIANNSAGGGGGLFGCDGMIQDNTISGNSANGGGGLRNCNGTIQNNDITDNSASTFGGGLSGCGGTIQNNVITNNSAGDGGGLSGCGGTIQNNVITGNEASGEYGGFGGGVYGCYGTIQNNVITGNSADCGGGLYWCGTIRNNTISGNSATDQGGGLDGCTGVIVNCIIWGNTAPVYPQISNDSIPNYSCIEGYTVGQGQGNIGLNPRFVGPNNFHLLRDSPCIDAGTNANCPATDKDGNPRPSDGNNDGRAVCDMGAYEHVFPNLTLTNCDFAPSAPVRLQPGASVSVGAFIDNDANGPAGAFWLEFWGSRTGGLTLDYPNLVVNSEPIGGLGAHESRSITTTKALNPIPDGPYTVVFVVDRPNQVPESNEGDNRFVVRGKRLLVIRPQTNVDLVVENFSLGPNPAHSGQPIQLGGQVRNAGSENSGPFWIEFWGSRPDLNPDLHFMLCDSIRIDNLAPSAAVELSAYSRTLYPGASGTFWVGCFADRPDSINELDETNNYQFIPGHAFNTAFPSSETTDRSEAETHKQALPDLVITHFDFSPQAPTQSKPGDSMTMWITIANQGSADAGPFWMEWWGSNLGGLNIWPQLMDQSLCVSGLRAGESRTMTLTRPLMGVPDGPYTVVAVLDRLGQVAESNEGNNRYAVSGKRVLVARPSVGANLVLENFMGVPSLEPLGPGRGFLPIAKVRNAGTENSGTFWIEFWASRDQSYPQLDFILCDSIKIENLAPGEMIDLAEYWCIMYRDVPPGNYGIVCFVDRVDQVNETDESDNYQFLRDQSIVP